MESTHIITLKLKRLNQLLVTNSNKFTLSVRSLSKMDGSLIQKMENHIIQWILPQFRLLLRAITTKKYIVGMRYIMFIKRKYIMRWCLLFRGLLNQLGLALIGPNSPKLFAEPTKMAISRNLPTPIGEL